MPTFLMLSTLGPDGMGRIHDDPARIREVNAEVEAMGVKVLHQWALLGQWDFATVVESPDARTMARVAVNLGARGTLRTHTLTAFPVDEFIGAVGEDATEA